MNYRRYCLLKRHAALAEGLGAVAAVWLSKQREAHGTPLPEEARTEALSAAGYTHREDLDGATLDELLGAGVPHADATDVLAFLSQPSP